MNPITYAIDQVMLKIPRPILDRAFVQAMSYHRAVPIDVGSRIRDEVVERRVRVDCNLQGGVEVTIPLINVSRERIDDYNLVFYIPKTLTQGRTITRAMSVSFGERSITSHGLQTMNLSNPMVEAAVGVMNSQMPIPHVATSNVQMIGENVLLIRDNFSLPNNVYLTCRLEHDEAMTHLKPPAFKAFAKLVEYATKSYIYNKLIVELDQGALYGGKELGVIRDIITEYADAEENYETHYNEVWRKVSYMNDSKSHLKHIKRMVGGLR